LEFHGIGSPHGGVTEDERFYWLSRETFVSLLQAIVETREGSDLPVAITFDDGNESDVLIALLELSKFKSNFLCRRRADRYAPLP